MHFPSSPAAHAITFSTFPCKWPFFSIITSMTWQMLLVHFISALDSALFWTASSIDEEKLTVNAKLTSPIRLNVNPKPNRIVRMIMMINLKLACIQGGILSNHGFMLNRRSQESRELSAACAGLLL
jgi:hypothetical protein